MRRTTGALVAAMTASALFLTACSSDADSDPTSDSAAQGATDQVKVTFNKDKKAPTVAVKDAPVTAETTASKVVKEGSGSAASDQSIITVDLAMFNGKDGKAIKDSETYSSKPVPVPLGDKNTLPGFAKSLKGAKQGQEGFAIIPPADAFGEQGQPQFGVGATDNLILVYSVRSVFPSEAKGKAAKADPKLPKVTYNADAPAKITIPKGVKAPTKLTVKPLITGEGKKVAKGDVVYVNYTGALWRNGEVFDSSLQEGRGPFAFTAGSNEVIKGWSEGLIGQKVGSRVIAVVPPKDGYGKQGQPQGGIKGTDTLVFVIDILGTA
ncbi:FKBP-type peptidyl-prolyl cis-trans isomerase [Janibacter sp. GXQ6167]|uniref:FKBP-type peptidyl-prolyl cis-trans isomerase n=1 Tax=Janibacter sp. GXQ6167 TaxID=3240791 RepID=UPI003525789E